MHDHEKIAQTKSAHGRKMMCLFREQLKSNASRDDKKAAQSAERSSSREQQLQQFASKLKENVAEKQRNAKPVTGDGQRASNLRKSIK